MFYIVKAVLLAAGKGIRLRPLTYVIPKCLVPILDGGSLRPLLGVWFDKLDESGISEVYVNTHWRHKLVEKYVQWYNRKNGSCISTWYEPELLGTAGTVLKAEDFLEDDLFIVIYGDHLSNVHLREIIKYHNEHSRAILTMALFRTNRPELCGISTLDDDGRIINFIEKPEKPESNLANAGIYIGGRELLREMGQIRRDAGVHLQEPYDFGLHVLPKLVGRMYGYEIGCECLDIGTLDNYLKSFKRRPK